MAMQEVVVGGVVKNGVVVPVMNGVPLPEGAWVELVVHAPSSEESPELQAEFDLWERASDEALELVERMANEGVADAKG